VQRLVKPRLQREHRDVTVIPARALRADAGELPYQCRQRVGPQFGRQQLERLRRFHRLMHQPVRAKRSQVPLHGQERDDALAHQLAAGLGLSLAYAARHLGVSKPATLKILWEQEDE